MAENQKEERWKKLAILEVAKISFIILAQSDTYIGSCRKLNEWLR